MTDAIRWAQYHDHEDFAVRDVFWGKGAAQQFMGPAAVDLTNLVSLALINSGLRSGATPSSLEQLLHAATGVTAHSEVLSEGLGFELSQDDRSMVGDTIEWAKRSFSWNAGRKFGVLAQILMGQRRGGSKELARMFGLRDRYEKDYETGEEARSPQPPLSRGR